MHVLLRAALALTASSVECERLFSLLNRINRQDRRRLSGETLEMLLLVARDSPAWLSYDYTSVVTEYRKKRRVRSSINRPSGGATLGFELLFVQLCNCWFYKRFTDAKRQRVSGEEEEEGTGSEAEDIPLPPDNQEVESSSDSDTESSADASMIGLNFCSTFQTKRPVMFVDSDASSD
jgi:hypothetical protein